MKEQSFDKLFRDKLTGFTLTPPQGAGEQLNARLNQHQYRVWLKFSRVAAALVLLAVCVYLINNKTEQLEEIIAQEINDGMVKSPVEDPTTGKTPINTESVPPLVSDRKTDILEVKDEKTPADKKVISQPQDELQLDKEQPIELFAEEPTVVAEPKLPVAFAEKVATEDTETAEPKRSKVTITYIRSDPAPDQELAMQDQGNQKPSGLKKLWKKAQMVDYQSFSLAGIRATKDELLAINKKDKTKETNPN